MADRDPKIDEQVERYEEQRAEALRLKALTSCLPGILECLQGIAKGKGPAAASARACLDEINQAIKAAAHD
jgi:hypothetical protein